MINKLDGLEGFTMDGDVYEGAWAVDAGGGAGFSGGC
jgi:hypothetical protein